MSKEPSGRQPLAPVPWDAVDRSSLLARHGSYRGALRAVDLTKLAPDRLERLARHKRWIWATVSTEQLVLALAVVDLGYATSTFAYAWSAREGMLVDVAQLGLPGLASVRRDGVDRVRALFRSAPFTAKAKVTIKEPVGGERIEVIASYADLELSGYADLREAPSPMTAIAPVEGGIVNVTEKRVLAPFFGAALVGGRRFSLDGARFAWDVTEGLLGRSTRWKWAFAQGQTVASEGAPLRFAFNLVEGFVGAPECTVWLDGKLVPVGEGRFEHTEGSPLSPWKVRSTCGTIAFEVTPTAMHADQQDLKLIKSRFFQALGLGSGVIQHEGVAHRFEATPIIVEDQDMLW